MDVLSFPNAVLIPGCDGLEEFSLLIGYMTLLQFCALSVLKNCSPPSLNSSFLVHLNLSKIDFVIDTISELAEFWEPKSWLCCVLQVSLLPLFTSFGKQITSVSPLLKDYSWFSGHCCPGGHVPDQHCASAVLEPLVSSWVFTDCCTEAGLDWEDEEIIRNSHN